MDLIQLLIIVVVVALVFWLLSRYVTPLLPTPWGNVLLAIVALIVIVWLLSASGLLAGLRSVRVGGPLVPPVAAEVDWADDPAGSTCPCDSPGETRGEAEKEQDYPIPG